MMKYLRKITDRVLAPYLSRRSKLETGLIPATSKGVQILLSLRYHELLRQKAPLPAFADIEFRAYSQNGEDGILLYIFSLIDTKSKKTVEICIGNGVESNTANLIVNHGWSGLLFDGDEKNIRIAREFYEHSPDTFISPPKIVKAWITAENVNSLIRDNGFSNEIDLLSLDLDGVDYWIWKAIDAINPRVVMCEYHEELGYEAITVPYDANFAKGQKHPLFFGASLPAFVSLAKAKGYRLVGCNRQKFNAFFVRNDIAAGILPEIPWQNCMRSKNETDYTLTKELSNLPFTNV